MTVFAVHTLESAPDAAKPLLEGVKSRWGFLPNLQGTLAESPELLEAYETLFALVGRSTLTPAEQQVVFLTTSVFHACEYCTAGHTYLGRAAKLDETAIAAVRDGVAIPDPKLQALRRFTQQVIELRGDVGEGALAAFLAAGFTRRNALEVVLVVATKTISNYTNHIAHTPLESFMSDPALKWTAPAQHAA